MKNVVVGCIITDMKILVGEACMGMGTVTGDDSSQRPKKLRS